MPFILYHLLPFIGGVSIPGYGSMVLMVCLAILAAHGIAWLNSRLPNLAWLSPVFGLLILVESATTPISLFGARPNAVFDRLRADPTNEAVLLSPVGWTTELGGLVRFDIADMYFAAVAQKPIVGGEVSRVPKQYLSFYEDQAALSVLFFPEKPPSAPSQDRQLVTDALHQLKIGYIVLRKSPFYEAQTKYVRAVLNYPDFYDDADVSAFRVPAS
jgi:hypothetical protein